MSFLEKYIVTPRLLTSGTKRRSGRAITPGVRFVVAHDTGNPGSTAAGNVRYYENSRNEMSASAHLFVDDREILECIPALTGPAEKAWHVLYNVTTDNALFGVNANDAAVGVEYCFGGRIDPDEAYRKYLWTIAYVCAKFQLDPKTSVVGHFFLDPERKTDPVSGLAHSRRTYEQLLNDVVAEYLECLGTPPPARSKFVAQNGTVHASVRLNIRKGQPSTKAPVVQVVPAGTLLAVTGWEEEGERINNVTRWYKTSDGNYFWAGGAV